MVKDRLMLENLIEGVPATWHRSAGPLSGPSPAEGEKSRGVIPTQLVYPNGSFNVGVKVESVSLASSSIHHLQEAQDTEESQQGLTIVYATPTQANMRHLYPAHRLLMISWLVYLIMALFLEPRIRGSPDATVKSTRFMLFCWFSLFDMLAFMAAIWRYGFRELMRLNTSLMVIMLLCMVLNLESIPSIVLSGFHGAMIMAATRTLRKCTSAVFIVSER